MPAPMSVPEISNPIQGVVMVNNDRVQLNTKRVVVNTKRVQISS